MGALYQIEFPNGKSYIGITRLTAERRLAVHSYRRNHAAYAICNALKKYGRENALARTLVIANDWDYLCELERKAIVAYGTKVPNGYNMTDGGETPTGLSADGLARIGAAAKGNTYNVGKKRTLESRAKMSASAKGNSRNKGRKHRPEVVEAIRARAIGRKATPETIAKMSASHIGIKWSVEARANMSLVATAREEKKRRERDGR